MIFRWLICSSLAAVALRAGEINGKVVLRDSQVPAVKKGLDYSGVVISFVPVSPAAFPVPSKHAVMEQKNKTFLPHVLAVQAGTQIDFPNLDPIFHNAFSNYSGQTFDVGLYPPGTKRTVRFTRPGVVRVFCNIHSAMSAIIVVLETPYFAASGKDGSWRVDLPAGEYEMHVFHERAAEANLKTLTPPRDHGFRIAKRWQRCSVGGRLPCGSARQQVRQTISRRFGRYELLSGSAQVIRRLSLLWKILLSTSIALTALFALTGWFVQQQTLAALSQNLQSEIETSSRAYQAVWQSRTETLRSVSLVLSGMPDVRSAFGTRDRATIRDTAQEIWSRISHTSALFLVCDPTGSVIASLGGGEALGVEIAAVRDSVPHFPAQAAGFSMENGRLYELVITPVYIESGAGLILLNVLVAGFPVLHDVAEELRSRTGSDFVFLAGGRVVTSTLEQDTAAQLATRYRRVACPPACRLQRAPVWRLG